MVRRLHFRRALGCLALFLMWYGSVAGGRGQQSSATSATSGSTEPTSHATEFLTPNGQPDLQGRWDFSTVTPWERPAGTPLHLDFISTKVRRVRSNRSSWSRETSTWEQEPGALARRITSFGQNLANL